MTPPGVCPLGVVGEVGMGDPFGGFFTALSWRAFL